MIVVLSLLSGIQAAIIAVWLQEHVKAPIAPADFSSLIYIVFLSTTVLAYGLLKKNVFNPAMIQLYAAILLSLEVLALLALFKLIVYDYRGDLARGWFNALGWLLLALPFLWVIPASIEEKIRQSFNQLMQGPWRMGREVVVLLAIVMLVFIPDIEGLLAHIFMGEYMHHTDTFVMGPAWAVSKGAVIDVDFYSRYGIGSVHFFTWIMKAMGGVSYANFFTALVVLCTIYFMLVYVLLRQWLKSTSLAFASWCLIFKAHIAFELAYPIVYTYPQSTVGRQWPDIIWMMAMFYYLRTGRLAWLVLASIAVGFAAWYMPSIGLYMLVAHGLLCAMRAWVDRGQLREKIAAALWPPAASVLVAMLLLLAICGHWFFSPVFWHNATDFVKMFLLTNTVPLTQTLVNKQFLNFAMFCIIVLVYVGTIAKVILDFFAKKSDQSRRMDWLALGLSVYGLGLLEHYVTFSIGNNYYTKTVPFFIVTFHWIKQILPFLKFQWQGPVKGWILFFAMTALITNHSFISYPNAVNVFKDPLIDPRVARPLPGGRPYLYHKHRMTLTEDLVFPSNSLGNQDEKLVSEGEFKTTQEMIERYRQDSDFRADAKLIQSLTSSQEKVALISSYDVRILMQADRPPFFFFFPIVATRPMNVRSLPNEMMDTEWDTERVIKDIKAKKPEFIFVEKIMTRQDIPPGYQWHSPGLLAVLDYVNSHYVPFKDGHYLMALKRKE